MPEPVHVFVLTKLVIDPSSTVVSKNIGVTFNIHEADLHRGDGVANNYETFQIDANWQEDAATSELVIAMRTFRSMVEEMQAEALR